MSNQIGEPVTDGNVTISGTDSEETLKSVLTPVDKGAKGGKVDSEAARPSAGKGGDSAAPDGEEDDDAELAEDADDSESEDEEKDKDEDRKPKKKGGWQRRVDKLTRELNERSKELENWRQAALGSKATPDKPESNGGKKETPVAAKPDPDAPKIENFSEYADYLEALTEYRVEQRFKAQEQKAQKAEIEKVAKQVEETWKTRLEAASKRYDDFEEIKKTDLPLTLTARQIVMDSEVGPDMVYWMAKNPEKAIKIMESPPIIQAKELGKLEDKLLEKIKPGDKGKGGEKPPVSAAPKPITNGVGGNRGKATVSPDEMSYSEYKAYREGQLKAQGRSIRS